MYARTCLKRYWKPLVHSCTHKYLESSVAHTCTDFAQMPLEASGAQQGRAGDDRGRGGGGGQGRGPGEDRGGRRRGRAGEDRKETCRRVLTSRK